MNICTDNNKRGSKDKLISREIPRFPTARSHNFDNSRFKNDSLKSECPHSQGDDIIKAKITF